MRAISLEQFGGVENFAEVSLPVPVPAAHEVRIKIFYCAINPVDFKVRRGDFGGNLPVILGCDLSGVIDAMGEGVKHFKLGDEVFAYLTGQMSNGAYAEYVCVPAAFVALKPQRLNFAQAAALPLVSLTAYQAVEKIKIKPDTNIFIAGASGGVGSIALQLLRAKGAKHLWATATKETSVQYLAKTFALPPENIITNQSHELNIWQEKILAQTQGQLFSACFDFVGGLMKELCLSLVDFDGDVVTIVEEPKGININIFDGRTSPLFARSASLHFEFLGARAFFGSPDCWQIYHQQLKAIAQLVDDGKIQTPVITELGGLSVNTIQEAHRLQEEGKVVGKLAIKVV
ncbi:MAG: putative oxidoreductase, Zn-binding protein [Gammaproteobacteria bacterium]|jgi:NADPH2:quinone reductase|nr:putative oxidoreductase, Zn-binding protein [Gammaproteobacteria bacterium]